ncbi:uncharacterized protein V1518DRAFT_429057 [Limtongia smithiae]|uniref:uncharacterized protein n=1 Tax=Limtongia smithiae TaxID=1125753 RepID=UPI0034CE38CB
MSDDHEHNTEAILEKSVASLANRAQRLSIRILSPARLERSLSRSRSKRDASPIAVTTATTKTLHASFSGLSRPHLTASSLQTDSEPLSPEDTPADYEPPRGRFLGRGRGGKSTSHKRTSSIDVAKPTGLGNSIFPYISAASKIFSRNHNYSEDNDDGQDSDDQGPDDEFDDDDLVPSHLHSESPSVPSINLTPSEEEQQSGLAATAASLGRSTVPPAPSSASNSAGSSEDNLTVSRHLSRLTPIISVGSVRSSAQPTPAIEQDQPDLDGADDRVKNSVSRITSDALAEKLMQLFDFDHKEVVHHEFSCSLSTSQLLAGHMFITDHHVAFLPHIPHKISEIPPSGALSRRTLPTGYTRYWCVLRDNVFSYFKSSSDLYFPVAAIDLRIAASAEIVPSFLTEAAAGSNPVQFSITTQDSKKYHFRADSYVSAKNWVKVLQNAIFKAHNESVKIAISIDKLEVVEVAGATIKISVLDKGEIDAMDEYFFVFANEEQVAFKALKDLLPTSGLSETKSHDTDDYEQHAATSTTDESSPQTTRTSAPYLAVLGGKKPGSPRPHSPAGGIPYWRNRGRRRSRSDSSTMPRTALSPEMSPISRSSSPMQRIAVFHGKMQEKVKSLVNLHDSSQHPPIATDGSMTDDEMVDVSVPESQPTSPQGGYLDNSQQREGWSEWVRKGGKKVTNFIPSASYVEKVTEMWAGNSRHFGGNDEFEEHMIDDNADFKDSEKESSDRFRLHFALPDEEKLEASFYAYLHRTIPLYGKIYLGSDHFCFRSLLPGTKTRMVLPHEDIENAEKKLGFRFGYSGLVVVIQGHEEIFFEFRSKENRDDCVVTLLNQLDSRRFNAMQPSGVAIPEAMPKTRPSLGEPHLSQCSFILSESPESPTLLSSKFRTPMKFTCLTIGSRGDVQPYIALAKGLMKEGHRVCIATHIEFEGWITSYGIEFRAVAGNPTELMRLGVEHGMFTYSFLKEASKNFRAWITQLLETAWVACQGTDVLIESPSAMAGYHIAEALKIPYFRAFTMPWTRTRAYPHAFAVPDQKMGGSYNYLTYVMFDNVFWKGISKQVNKWRMESLNLPRTTLDKMQIQRVPFLFNVSPAVVPPPLDYSDWIKVTGYWFLDEGGKAYEPDPKLVEFINKARKENKKLVYIGFGSIVVARPKELTQAVVDAVVSADVRCILCKGWSDRMNDENSQTAEIPLPEEYVFPIRAAPHDWLFPQMDAAVHHGGSGSTGASLRAGIPTIIKPFFGDQFFYATRVEDLGAGIHLRKLTVRHLKRALVYATHEERMIAKARLIGERIGKEDGVAVAISTLYREMEYAKGVVIKNAERDENWYMVQPEGEPSADMQGPA